MTSDKILDAISLAGKVAVISGAGSGLGRGMAMKLAEAGATVAVLDIDAKGGAETVAAIGKVGGTARLFKCDVRSSADCAAAVSGVIDAFTKIDILCNNAGVARRKNVCELEEQDWDLSLDVTLKGVYMLSHHVVPRMIANGGGAIVNTGSGWSLRGGEDAVAYCAAKGGVLNLTRAMCLDHGKHNIRVNTVCPGDVDTPMLQSECEQLGGTYDETFRTECAERPLARLGTPEDIGNAVLFLVSDLASWVSGAHLVVDGGGIAG